MTLRETDPEEKFAQELEKRHAQIVQGKSDDKPEHALDPAVINVEPALNLIEEVRRFEEANAQACIDTPPIDSTDGVGLSEFVGLNYGETQRIGRFEIHEQLGQGGFGIVFRALDTSLGREVAIKIPRFEASLSDEARRRFAREAQAAASLNHPNIVGVYETGSEQGVDFIVCELVEGQDLAARVKSQGPLEPRQAAEMLVELGHALEHAHGRGVFHRDLKPSNVLVEKKLDLPRISDFGLATIVDSNQEVTQTGAALGTPAYMSPEQAAGKTDSIGGGTDIYGLGAILFFCLSGRAPFDGHSPVETLRAVTKDEPPSLRSLGSNAPVDLEAICHKCLEKHAVNRYGSAQQLCDDLQRFLDGKPVAARPITRVDRARRWVVHNPLVAAPIAFAMLCLLAALAVISYGLYTTKQSLDAKTLAEKQARENYDQLKGVVDTYYKEIDADPMLKSMPGAEPLRQKLLNRACEFYEQFIVQNADDTSLRLELADTELRIAKILNANGDYQDGLETLRSAETRINQFLRSEDSQNQPLMVRDESRRLQAQVAFQLAVTLRSIGDIDSAKKEIDSAVLLQREMLAERQADFQSKQALAKSLRSACLINTRLRNQQAAIQFGEESVGLFAELIVDDESDSSEVDRLEAIGLLADAYASINDLAKAEEMHLKIFDFASELIENEPNRWDVNRLLLVSALQASPLAFARGDFESPLPRLLFAEQVADRMIGLHPKNRVYVDLRLGLIKRLAVCYDETGDIERAHALSIEAVDTSRLLAEGPESTFDNRLNLCSSIVNLIVFRNRRHLLTSESQSLVDEAAILSAECHAEQPQNENAHLGLVHVHRCQAWLHETNGNVESAVNRLGDAISMVVDLFAAGAKHGRTITIAKALHVHRARLLEKEKRFGEALEDRKKQLEYAELLNRPQSAQLSLALAYARLGQVDDAHQLFTVATSDELQKSERELVARYHALLHHLDEGNENAAVTAVNLLGDLASDGYFKSRREIESLEHSDFDTLRPRTDFKALRTAISQ